MMLHGPSTQWLLGDTGILTPSANRLHGKESDFCSKAAGDIPWRQAHLEVWHLERRAGRRCFIQAAYAQSNSARFGGRSWPAAVAIDPEWSVQRPRSAGDEADVWPCG